MWNPIKYPHLEWFKRDLHCVPKGPSFKWAPWKTLPLVGCRLRLKVPRHSPADSPVKQYDLPFGEDPVGQSMATYPRMAMANDHWGYWSVLSRFYAFWGPWMSGCKAELSFAISVIGRLKEFEFSKISFFHPRAFESVLTQYLNNLYGHRRWGSTKTDSRPRRAGPFDWKPHYHLPVFGASCKIYNTGMDGKTRQINPECLFFFPISDQHFVRVRFKRDLYDRDNKGKPTYDASPVRALQEAIFSSMSLELSPEAQASYDRVKAQCPDMRLTEDFAPLDWPTEAVTPGEVYEPEGPPQKSPGFLTLKR